MSSPACRSLRRRSAHQVSAATVCTTRLEHREYDDRQRHRHQQPAGELSTDEVNKTETVLNNSCEFKLPAHMLNGNSAHDYPVVYDVTDKESFNNAKAWMGEIDKHVSDSVNKLLIENRCVT